MLKKAGLCLFKIIGMFLILYPFISDFIYSRTKDSMIITYDDLTDSLETQEIEQLIRTAEYYNEQLASSGISLLDFSKGDTSAAYSYESLLHINNQSSMMGYISIPCIDVKLPVFHGTSREVLEKGVGHLEGTSMPVGGMSTHAVLTGHTGINNARLFTDLTQVVEGDCFYITVFDRTLAYKVNKIQIVTPDQAQAVEIVKNKDLCTLVTCTPYGVNSHRLLVTGERMEGTDIDSIKEELMTDTPRQSQWLEAYKKAVIIGVLVLFVFMIALKMMERIRRRQHRGKKKYKRLSSIDN